MKLKQSFLLGISALAAINVIGSITVTAQAKEKQSFNYKVECTSKGTKWNGERRSCYSAWSTHTLPSNFVYSTNSLKHRYTSKNGSKNRCEFQWADYVEVVPETGITMPRTLKIRAHARSPRHHRGARGWSKCVYTGQYVQYR